MIWATEVYCRQTLEDWCGEMNGGGFGDPVANDYAGIERKFNFQAGMLMGYSPQQAMHAERMGRIDAMRNRKYAKKSSNQSIVEQYPFLKEAENG